MLNNLFLLIVGAMIGFLSTIAVEIIRNRLQKNQRRLDWEINNKDKREKQIHEFIADGNPLAWLKLVHIKPPNDYLPLYIFDEVEQPVREPPKIPVTKTIRKYILTQTQIIGRSEECEILLDTIDVSRLHALIRFEKNKFRIYDLGSTMSTLVNHTRIDDQGRDLNNGDEVQVGETMFVFEETKNVSRRKASQK